MYLATYQPTLSQFIGDILDSSMQDGENQPSYLPRAYVTEKNGAYEVEVELPGVRKEDISLSVDKGLLTVKASRKREKEEYKYERSFRLTEEVDETQISASYENGVLHMNIAGKKEPPSRRIEIQ